jgi:hypothetical protein
VNLDELELELRKLPGIRWAAFSEKRDQLLVQLHAVEGSGNDLTLRATRVAAHHSEKPVSVEVVCSRSAPKPKSRSKAKSPSTAKSGSKRAEAKKNRAKARTKAK